MWGSGNYYSSSLDVEGLEEGVLETVPWQKVILSCVLETVCFYHATFRIQFFLHCLSEICSKIFFVNIFWKPTKPPISIPKGVPKEQIRKWRVVGSKTFSRIGPIWLFTDHHFSNQVDIGVVQVEFTHSNKTNLLRIMEAAGFDNPFNLLEDLVFVKRGRRFT